MHLQSRICIQYTLYSISKPRINQNDQCWFRQVPSKPSFVVASYTDVCVVTVYAMPMYKYYMENAGGVMYMGHKMLTVPEHMSSLSLLNVGLCFSIDLKELAPL